MFTKSLGQIVKAFNNCFSKTYPPLCLYPSSVNVSFLFRLLKWKNPYFFFSLKLKKYFGTDGIFSFILKKVFGSICEPLKLLSNDSLSSVVFLDTYKTVKIVSIFKKADDNYVSKYRIIYVLCTM